ncbi:hypothetical protein [Thiohalophilus thiocyanatoxydans]|uniref:Uncharacterized protein n=1 Tax=Thiohalophilus thiocyanatoxydans TaxID=381308 RepID=A0A4R8IN87_9GAMM|nr:hypothetical protein [Thiohalophilus thiocyanatoxydans]TDY00580.1 hypothetical protein EDC23_2083 [Thiohalophilus thiocyanatoxydans]
MSFLLYSVPIPLWLLILMIAVMAPTLIKLGKLAYRLKQGEIVREEEGDTVVWKVQNRVRAPKTPRGASDQEQAKEKEREKKAELAQILKILIKEGEKGVLMKTIADRMGISMIHAQHAMQKLMDKNMVEEVTGVSGTKYYLTQAGKEYCRRKAR